MQQRFLTLVTVGALAVATTNCTPRTSSSSTPTPSATVQAVAETDQTDDQAAQANPADSDTQQTVTETDQTDDQVAQANPEDSDTQQTVAAADQPDEQIAIRNQYRTVPLETLFSELPVIGSNAEAIAMRTFGRTDLGEGEQPTVVTNEGYQGDYLVINLTNEGLADDSVGGYRYRLEFESFDNDQVKLVWVGEQNYCWRSTLPRWTADLCP
ncbi:MAG: hypothetical protein AAFX95_17420 [Cyanobacteria bacterium J06639_16]